LKKIPIRGAKKFWAPPLGWRKNMCVRNSARNLTNLKTPTRHLTAPKFEKFAEPCALGRSCRAIYEKQPKLGKFRTTKCQKSVEKEDGQWIKLEISLANYMGE